MNRRTFLGLLAGSVLFPGVPEKSRMFLDPDEFNVERGWFTYPCGYHERNVMANMWQDYIKTPGGIKTFTIRHRYDDL